MGRKAVVLARKAFLIFTSNVLGALLGLVALFFVGRYMDPTIYGMVGFSLAAVGLASVLANLGLGSAHVKRISEGQDLGRCIGTYLRLKMVLIAVSTVILTGAVFAWEAQAGFSDATTLSVLVLFIAYFFLQHLRSGVVDTFRALRQTAKAEWVGVWDSVSRVVLVVLVAVAYGSTNGRIGPLGTWPARWLARIGIDEPWSRQEGALYLAGAFVAGMLVSLLVAVAIFIKHRYPLGPYDAALARRYWQFALPLALISAVGILANQMDSVMIGYFWHSTEVGYYFTAQRLVLLFAVIPSAVGTLFFPLMSELAGRRQAEGVHAVAASAQRLLLLVLLPLLLVIVFEARSILHVMVSDRFLPAAPILVTLTITTVFQAVSVVGISVLRGFDLPRMAAAVGVLNVALNALLNVLFIPESILGVPLLGLQAEGAALATMIAQAVTTVVVVAVTRRQAGPYLLRPYLARQLAAFAATAAVVAMLHAIGVLATAGRVWDLALAVTVALAIHAGFLTLFRELTRRDVRYFLDLADPGKMAHYVREELRGRP